MNEILVPKEKPKPINGFVFWIDADVKNSENTSYLKYLEEHPLYKQFNLKVICFDNLTIAFDSILNSIDFKILIIIISGRLYSQYYKVLNLHMNLIKCLPISIIFTSDRTKNIIFKTEGQSYLTGEARYSLNVIFLNNISLTLLIIIKT